MAAAAANPLKLPNGVFEALPQLFRLKHLDIAVAEIDSAFDHHPQSGQMRAKAVDQPGELPGEGANGRPGGLAGIGVDQVGDGFGPQQIDLAIEKGAFGKLAWPGLPRPERQRALAQGFEDDAPAMALQFEHVFAGERVGRGEKQRDALVEHRAAGPAEVAVMGLAGFGRETDQVARQAGERGAGNAQDANAGAARRGGDGADDIFVHHWAWIWAGAREGAVSIWRRRTRRRSCG